MAKSVIKYKFMEKNNEKIKAGWMIPENVKDEFTRFCADKGTLAQEDCAGALIVWQSLPAQLREWAKSVAKGENPVRPTFWRYVLPHAIEQTLRPDALSDEVLDTLAAQIAAENAALADISSKIAVKKKRKPKKQNA